MDTPTDLSQLENRYEDEEARANLADCGHDPGIYPIRLDQGIVICNKCFKQGTREIALSEYQAVAATFASYRQ